MAERYSTASMSCAEDEDSSHLLANALRKMDGLIGNFRPVTPEPSPAVVLSTDPMVLRIVDHCDKLHTLIAEWTHKTAVPCGSTSSSPLPSSPAVGALHPRVCVAMHVQESIIAWLGGANITQSQQLVQDKGELLDQVVSLQREVEACQTQSSKLASKMEGLEKVCMQKDQQLRETSEELRLSKVMLSTKEVELRHLKDQFQAGYRPEHEPKQVSFASQEPVAIRRSFRKAIKKALGFNELSSSKNQGALEQGFVMPTNPRGVAFCDKNCVQLSEWLTTIGLTMYTDVIEGKQVTGRTLAEMVTDSSNLDLLQLGILSSLHCKKLRLSVEAAMSESTSDEHGLSELDHDWVGQWLVDLGLPQFKQVFMDACVDGHVLNVITMEDLRLLDITASFHISSIKRGVQALRMCGYNKDYMTSATAEKSQGCQKLLHWSTRDVYQWLCKIELEEYASGLDSTGIHGAVMYLDVNFTSESLARVLGISQTKTILHKHLSRKFMELIGPVASQNKVDAMQSKSFVCLDPTEPVNNFSRARSRSMGAKRGPKKTVSELLLPLDNQTNSSANVQSSSARSTTPPPAQPA